jgi:hypothetical protein
LAETFSSVLVLADAGVLKGRRHGNVVFAASREPLPLAEIRRASARTAFPRTVHADGALVSFAGGARPLTDADPMRSPAPPEEAWRVLTGDEDY